MAEDKNIFLDPNNPSLPQLNNQIPAGSQNPPVQPQYAGFWVRFAALIIDGISLGLPVLLGAVGLGLLFQLDSTADTLQSLLFIVAVLFFVVRYGATPGKMYYGLKIIREDGSKPNLKTALIREIVGKFVSGLLLNLGFFWVAFDKEKQGIHDKIAKTHVILTKPLSKGRKILVYILVSFLPIIVIGGILAAAILVGVNPAKRQNQAKDSARKSDIGQIATALEAYQYSSGKFPQSLVDLVTTGDLRTVPIDPRGGQYVYTASPDGSSSVVYANLEAGVNSSLAVWCWRSTTHRATEVTSAFECKP